MRGEQACLVEDDDDEEEEEENGDHDIGVPVKSRPIGPVPPSQIKPPDRRIKPGRTAATLTTVRSVSHQPAPSLSLT